MKKVLGLGNALTDVLLQVSDDDLRELGLPKGSMNLISMEQWEQIQVRFASVRKRMVAGGSASNTISTIASLGGKAAFIGKIGNDEVGTFYREDLIKNGVNPILLTSEDKMSGCSIVLITPDGERTFATHLGVAAGLSAQDITPELFQGYDLLHIEGYLVQNHELMETVCQTARQMGLRTSIDLASWNVVQADLDFFHHLVQDYIDIVFANEEESAAFTSGKAPSEALEEIASMCEVAVVKLGGKGASAMRAGEKVVIPARKIDVVDTTAAGDSFEIVDPNNKNSTYNKK